MYVNGKPFPLRADLRFAFYQYFSSDHALFEMKSIPPREVPLSESDSERGFTVKKLLPNGKYFAGVKEERFSDEIYGLRCFTPSTPVCLFVVNLPPTTTSLMLQQLIEKFETVSKAHVLFNSEGECNGRGWVTLCNPFAIASIPRLIEFTPAFPGVYVQAEFGYRVPDEIIEPPGEKTSYLGSSLPHRGSETHVDASGSHHYPYSDDVLSSSLPGSFPAAITPPSPLTGSFRQESAYSPHSFGGSKSITNGSLLHSDAQQRRLPHMGYDTPSSPDQCGHDTSFGGSPFLNRMISSRNDSSYGLTNDKYFIVHLTKDEACKAVEDRCFYPNFCTDCLVSSSSGNAMLLITIHNNSLFFGLARCITQNRVRAREVCMLQWVYMHLSAPVKRFEMEAGSSLSVSGAELPPFIAGKIISFMKESSLQRGNGGGLFVNDNIRDNSNSSQMGITGSGIGSSPSSSLYGRAQYPRKKANMEAKSISQASLGSLSNTSSANPTATQSSKGGKTPKGFNEVSKRESLIESDVSPTAFSKKDAGKLSKNYSPYREIKKPAGDASSEAPLAVVGTAPACLGASP